MSARNMHTKSGMAHKLDLKNRERKKSWKIFFVLLLLQAQTLHASVFTLHSSHGDIINAIIIHQA